MGPEEAFRLTSYATETPMMWGWSHVPVFGVTIADNIIEDSLKGGTVGVEHNKKVIKSNKGRVYMTARVDRNVVRWSDAFLAARKQAKAGERRIPTGLTMGIPPSIDPDELRIQASGNRAEVPKNARYAPILSIPSAQFNGRRMVDAMFRLPGDPTLGK